MASNSLVFTGMPSTYERPLIRNRMAFIIGPSIFAFNLNPTKLQVSRKKLEKYILTKFGFERQYWQNDLYTFSYSGTTLPFRPEGDSRRDDGRPFDISQTPAWLKFEEFDKFYRDVVDEREVKLSYWGMKEQLVGSLNDFSFGHDANDPFRILYSFKFTGIPLKRIGISADFVGPEFVQTATLAPAALPQPLFSTASVPPGTIFPPTLPPPVISSPKNTIFPPALPTALRTSIPSTPTFNDGIVNPRNGNQG